MPSDEKTLEEHRGLLLKQNRKSIETGIEMGLTCFGRLHVGDTYGNWFAWCGDCNKSISGYHTRHGVVSSFRCGKDEPIHPREYLEFIGEE